jgi:hypothetical protein
MSSTQSYTIDASNRISVDELGLWQNGRKEDVCFYTVNSEIENLNDLLTDGDELLKVRIMIWVEEEQAVHQRHTDKKEKKIFLICKEIQMGSAAKSYMRKSFKIYEEMHKYLTICEETACYILLCNWSLLNFLICEEKLIFFLISEGQIDQGEQSDQP